MRWVFMNNLGEIEWVSESRLKHAKAHLKTTNKIKSKIQTTTMTKSPKYLNPLRSQYKYLEIFRHYNEI